MFKVNDLILAVGDSYLEFTDRLNKAYTEEFTNYPQSKLERVWKAIQEHHEYPKAPELGKVFKYMYLSDVSRTKDLGKSYNQCKKCGCNYSLRGRVCPECNRPLSIDDDPIVNDVIIIKAERYAYNHVSCHENCPICPNFKKSRNIMGAKCPGWNKDEYQKEGYKCDTCPCKWCCDELPEKNFEHEIGTIMDFVKGKTFNDPYWIEYYEAREIVKGKILKYTGKEFINITGEFSGQSPVKDMVNWKGYVRPKITKELY